MGIVTWRAVYMAGLMLAVLAGAAQIGQAQTLGMGARMVSVSGADSPAVDPSDSSSTRFAGGFLRFHASKHIAVEAAMDYQSTTNPTQTARVRNTPIQASALVYPLRTAVAPYLLAGVGWYIHQVEALCDGRALQTTHATDFGYHTGVGGQVMLGRHASLFVDYRYTWVDANGFDGLAGAVRSATSYTSVLGLLQSYTDRSDTNDSAAGISRSGSMWTGGMTIYF